MSQTWFYSDGEDRFGPVSQAELQQLAEKGQLMRRDLVWQEGMEDWVEARTISGLFPARREEERPRFDYEPDRTESRDRGPRRRRAEEDDYYPEQRRPRSRRRFEDEDEYLPGYNEAEVNNTKMVAGILAITVGIFGIHKFYLGFPMAGVLHILMNLFTCGMTSVLSFVEGILYLVKPPKQFYRETIVGKKEWF
ncbi:MAG: GYF domain-containing protein [Zavarzinella sp.]